MKKKLSTDLSKLSNIPEEYIDNYLKRYAETGQHNKVLKTCAPIIGNAVYESLLSSEEITDIDVGFGNIIIKADSKELKLKFVPSKDLEMDLKTINSGKEPELKAKLEKALVAKLIDMYKEIL